MGESIGKISAFKTKERVWGDRRMDDIFYPIRFTYWQAKFYHHDFSILWELVESKLIKLQSRQTELV